MRSFILIFLCFALVQCDHKHEEGDHSGYSHHNESMLPELKLNNNKKWKADAPTFKGIQEIDSLVTFFMKIMRVRQKIIIVYPMIFQSGLNRYSKSVP